MFELHLASFIAGLVFGMMCLSALICVGILVVAIRMFPQGEENENGTANAAGSDSGTT